jgi:hypothetical protein
MLDGNWICGRWDDNPQPIGKAGFEYNLAITNRRLARLFPTERQGEIDAYPFMVSFAMKKRGTKEFYHFNDESYAYADWCNKQWLFDSGTYRVEVRITGYGLLRPVVRSFKLINGAGYTDFTLKDGE